MPGGVIPGSHQSKFSKAFWEKARAKFGNDYLIFHEDTYAGISSKITVTCKKHGNFTRQANNFLASPVGCPACVKGNRRQLPVIIDQFIEQATIVHDGKYTYKHEQSFENIKTATVVITCPVHGDFMQKALQHLNGCGCKNCSLAAGTLRYTTESFIERAKKVHEGRYYDYSKTKFISGHDFLTVICPIHGEYSVEASNHLAGRECNDCCNQKATKTTEEFIKQAKIIHGDKYAYDKCCYQRANLKVIITCNVHGDFEQRASGHLKGSGCSKCSHTNSKKAIQWLEYMQIRTGLDIEHSGNGGEHYIEEIMPGKTRADIRVDGYHAFSCTVYEFQGTVFHADPRRYRAKFDEMHFCIPNKTYGEVYEATLKRCAWLRGLGYTLVEMWEIDWDKAVKAVIKIQRAFRKTQEN